MPRGKFDREGARPVGRRATQRVAREKKSGSLLIGNRDLLWGTTDSWTDALIGLNPDIDADIVKHGVEDLFTRLARPGQAGNSGGSQPAMASVAAPKYNVAGDILCMAHANFKKRNFKEALRLFATAMESEDAPDLIDGISDMNDQTDIGREVDREAPPEDEQINARPSKDKMLEREIDRALAEFSDEDDEDIAEDEEYDDSTDSEGDEFVDDSDAEEESEDEEEDEDEDEGEYEEATAELADDDIDQNAPEDSEETADDDRVPLGSTSSNSRAQRRPNPAREANSDREMTTQAKMRALANKLSLTGTDADRAKSAKVLRLKHRPKRR